MVFEVTEQGIRPLDQKELDRLFERRVFQIKSPLTKLMQSQGMKHQITDNELMDAMFAKVEDEIGTLWIQA